MMQGAIEYFQLTIAQLIDFSRLQKAYAALAEVIDLVVVVEAVRLDLAPELEATAARLTVDLMACPTVMFAPQYLRSVVYSLLSNAVKYYPRPALGAAALLRWRRHQLEVQDNGLGLRSCLS